jgi:hypothetical protein
MRDELVEAMKQSIPPVLAVLAIIGFSLTREDGET